MRRSGSILGARLRRRKPAAEQGLRGAPPLAVTPKSTGDPIWAPATPVRRSREALGALRPSLIVINLRQVGIAAYGGPNPRPVSPYGVTGIAAEYLAQVFWRNHKSRPSPSVISPCTVPPPRPDMAFHRLVASALSNQPFTVFGVGDQTRDFTFVADAVADTIAAAESGIPF